MAELPIAGGFYTSESLPISHQICINAYPNVTQSEGGLSAVSLFGTPGIYELLSTGSFPFACRGARIKNGTPYFLCGTTLFRVDRSIVNQVESFSYTALGTVEGEGFVSMADNGAQLMILVPDGKGYIYNENDATPFQEITDADFYANGRPQQVVFIDGYFACTTDTKRWIVSNLNDGLNWNELDFGSAESDPDVIVAPVVHQNQIFILGSETTEGFQNVGGYGFPFQRSNLFLDKGCVAPFSVINAASTYFMIGAGQNEEPSVYMFNGNGYDKIGTDAIDNVIQNYTDVELSEVYAWKYSSRGAQFIGWTFPDTSFVFDMMTGKWHERRSLVEDAPKGWRPVGLVTAYGRLLCGDRIDGRIGVIDKNTFSEYDNLIVREWSTQPFKNSDGRDLRSNILELTMESGVGNYEAPNPTVTLAISTDGKTFSYERIRELGKIGEYQRRVIWRKNGRFPRFVVFKFRFSDKAKFVAIKLESR